MKVPSFSEEQKKAIILSFLYIAFSDTNEEEALIANFAQLFGNANNLEFEYLKLIVSDLGYNLIDSMEELNNFSLFYGQKGIGEILSTIPDNEKYWYIDTVYKLIYVDGNMNEDERLVLDSMFDYMNVTDKKINETIDIYKYDCSVNLVKSKSYYDEGIGFLEHDQLQNALDSFDNSITCNAKNVDSLIGRGTVYIKLQDYEKAMSDFGNALLIDQNNYYIYIQQEESANLKCKIMMVL
jgi:tetratricopeptide (TPR) repeat protein